MNKLAAITAAAVASLGTAFTQGVIPAKYAGYVMILAAFIQAFQKEIHRKPE